MAKFFGLILLTSFVALSSAYPYVDELSNVVPRVFGGYPIAIRNVPWQVSLQLGLSHLCGGSIISENWVISAAHCLPIKSPSAVTLRMGSEEHANGGTIVKVKRIVVHEGYNLHTHDFDYALLELSEPLTFSDKVQRVELPTADDVLPDGSFCFISGWGKTSNYSGAPEKLQGVHVPIINHEACVEAYRDLYDVTPRMICAGYAYGEKDSCQGDSGGPLSCQVPEEDGPRKLMGIVSWGEGCGRANNPGVYSSVQAARQWIQLVTGV